MTSLQQMAYPAYLENNLAIILNFMLPLFIVLSFAFIVPPVLKRIVYEKETGVKVGTRPPESTKPRKCSSTAYY